MRASGSRIGAGLLVAMLQACVGTTVDPDTTGDEGTSGEELAGAMPGRAPAPPGAPPPLAPPPEAFEACEGKTAGEACGFVPPPRPVEGVCRPGPAAGDPVACAPMLPPPPPPLPPGAFEACEGASAGAACGFEIDGRVLEGTCRPGPRAEDPLGCAPPLPPPAPTPPALEPAAPAAPDSAS